MDNIAQLEREDCFITNAAHRKAKGLGSSAPSSGVEAQPLFRPAQGRSPPSRASTRQCRARLARLGTR